MDINDEIARLRSWLIEINGSVPDGAPPVRWRGRVMSAPARLTTNDHSALHEAADLVQTVCKRHPHEMRLPILQHLHALLHEIDAIEQLLDAA